MILGLAAFAPPPAARCDDLSILTFPVGLVVGEHPVHVDLGATGEPAELLLDGQPVCSFASVDTHCLVDLGAAPEVHLLELVRRDRDGHVKAAARRWVNRPGQEAELDLVLAPPSGNGICDGNAVWFHPDKSHPVALEVRENGRPLDLSADGHSFRFPCGNPREPHILDASAVFPDGRRAETVTMSSGFGTEADVDLTAVPLTDCELAPANCAALATALDEPVTVVDDAGFEVVFVLDPDAGYRGMLAGPGAKAQRGSAWSRAEASLHDAHILWFVVPDAQLHRVNGFQPSAEGRRGTTRSAGRGMWLDNLFVVATNPPKREFRLADAVAVSGLVAAAGPTRRAVILILGSTADRDASQFSPRQARAYLAEVGVSLVVLRIGKEKDDGWPRGTTINNMQAFAKALQAVKKALDCQCIAWFRGARGLADIAASLPDRIEVAGASPQTTPTKQ